MAEVAWKFREVSSSKHTKCCLDKYNLIFPLLRFGALIILFKENISLRCKRSCLRLVKKLTGEITRVNELYFLIEYKILEGFVCDVMSVHNRNMKQAYAIKFDETNLRDMLQFVLMAVSLIQFKMELKIEVY